MIIKTSDGGKTKILSCFPEWEEIMFGENVYSVIKGYRYSGLFALHLKIIFQVNYNAST